MIYGPPELLVKTFPPGDVQPIAAMV